MGSYAMMRPRKLIWPKKHFLARLLLQLDQFPDQHHRSTTQTTGSDQEVTVSGQNKPPGVISLP